MRFSLPYLLVSLFVATFLVTAETLVDVCHLVDNQGYTKIQVQREQIKDEFCSGSLLPNTMVNCVNYDNDCVASPAGTGPCLTGLLGQCFAGSYQCTNNILACAPHTPASVEICDGVDNDCDGTVDDDIAEVGQSCQVAGQQGVCADGMKACTNGQLSCVQQYQPSAEICDALDNDCDGVVNNGLDSSACDDNDACTTDLCTLTGCTNTPVVCPEGQTCNGGVCATPAPPATVLSFTENGAQDDVTVEAFAGFFQSLKDNRPNLANEFLLISQTHSNGNTFSWCLAQAGAIADHYLNNYNRPVNGYFERHNLATWMSATIPTANPPIAHPWTATGAALSVTGNTANNGPTGSLFFLWTSGSGSPSAEIYLHPRMPNGELWSHIDFASHPSYEFSTSVSMTFRVDATIEGSCGFTTDK